MALAFRRWWQSSPVSLTLTAEELCVRPPNGRERRVPITAVSEIRWPYIGSYTKLRYDGGEINVPKQVKDLEGLVIELRRRNPAIVFDGTWPPRPRARPHHPQSHGG